MDYLSSPFKVLSPKKQNVRDYYPPLRQGTSGSQPAQGTTRPRPSWDTKTQESH